MNNVCSKWARVSSERMAAMLRNVALKFYEPRFNDFLAIMFSRQWMGLASEGLRFMNKIEGVHHVAVHGQDERADRVFYR